MYNIQQPYIEAVSIFSWTLELAWESRIFGNHRATAGLFETQTEKNVTVYICRYITIVREVYDTWDMMYLERSLKSCQKLIVIHCD